MNCLYNKGFNIKSINVNLIIESIEFLTKSKIKEKK
jgi:hypothetical protein